MYSAAEEDYLKVMLDLEQSGSPATTGAIADRLGVRPASVTGMLRRLAKQKLIAYQPYRASKLTVTGRNAAVATLRRHRLIELFLVRRLGLPWDAVHAEAERWEHVVSEEVVDLMDADLGHPTRDPHGSPIPSADGHLALAPTRPLSEFSEGERVRVVELRDRDPELLRYLGELGIVPDARVVIVKVEPFNGPITLRIRRRTVVTGRDAVRHVLAVRRIES